MMYINIRSLDFFGAREFILECEHEPVEEPEYDKHASHYGTEVHQEARQIPVVLSDLHVYWGEIVNH